MLDHPNSRSAVTKRASGVLSGIFVHQDYRATSNGHYQRMSVSVVACSRNQSKIFDRSPYWMCGANPAIIAARYI